MLKYDDMQKALTVSPECELDHFAVSAMRQAIDDMITKTDCKTLVFDMANVEFMDSSGIGMLIGRYKVMRRRGCVMRVKNMRPQVARLFRMSGLGKIIVNDERI